MDCVRHTIDEEEEVELLCLIVWVRKVEFGRPGAIPKVGIINAHAIVVTVFADALGRHFGFQQLLRYGMPVEKSDSLGNVRVGWC